MGHFRNAHAEHSAGDGFPADPIDGVVFALVVDAASGMRVPEHAAGPSPIRAAQIAPDAG